MQTPEKHPLWLRINHWLNAPFLALMIWSGLLIYWANDVYPGFFPKWFYDLFGIGGRLAEGLSIHFAIGWFFTINGFIYLVWFFASGHWREIFPDRASFRHAIPTILHDMGLSHEKPPQGKFNAMQRMTYTGVIALAFVAVLSGFAIYKPVQLGWLTACFGGYKSARFFHFAAMISFCLFIGMHVVQVIRSGWPTFRAMVADSRRGFAIFFTAALAILFTWHFASAPRDADDDDETATALRAALEFNGRLWSPPSSRQCVRGAPPPGQIPRSNGDVGLLAELNLTEYRLTVVDGGQTLKLTLGELMQLPKTVTATEFKCIEGWSEDMSFGGIRFRDFMAAYHLPPKRYVGLVTVDGKYYVSIDMESMEHDQTLLAYEMNGSPLLPANGAPLRLVIPIKYGIKNLKQIGEIYFSDTRPPDYWAERGYDWYAGL